MARRRGDNHWSDYGGYRRFPASKPREAQGGIKARSKRGDFGESWWAKRWIAVLDSFHIGARLNRGRTYARKGQVLSISVAQGLVRAKVQGSRPQPYEVTIQAKMLTPADWKKVAAALARQAIFAAKLLAGEMPRDVEQVFQEAGLSLFPEKLGDLTTKCTCPDWSNPCKHIAAVYYLLGEEFDRDPFLIFTLRGQSREDLIDLMETAGLPRLGSPASGSPSVKAPPEPLEADASRFWGESSPADDLLGAVSAPPVAAALPRRLGGFPFWRGNQPFLEAIESTYSSASTRGLDALLGHESASPRSEDP